MNKAYKKSLITHSRHTGIIVKNMKESVHFYKNILGFNLISSAIVSLMISLTEIEFILHSH